MVRFLNTQTPIPTLQSISRVLIHARQLITPEEAWEQNAFAYDRYNKETHCLGNDAVCWCLTGSVWKALDKELNLRTDYPWKSYNQPYQKTLAEFGKKNTELITLTFRHLAAHVPIFQIIDSFGKPFADADPGVAISDTPNADDCHARLTGFNDDYNINQQDILLLLDKAIADISGLLHQQQNLPAQDFRPLVIFQKSDVFHPNDQPDHLTFLGTLSNHPQAPVTELLSAFIKQRGRDIELEPGDQLRIDIYPTLR